MSQGFFVWAFSATALIVLLRSINSFLIYFPRISQVRTFLEYLPAQ